ncbi:MAG TPA: hypothetical protein VHB51_04375 [Candidatus Saccharimonadales bacterium]|nr:hypothetical protein [Candidatus Saccharimonadales bacterium]
MRGKQTTNRGGDFWTPIELKIDWSKATFYLKHLNRTGKIIIIVAALLLANIGGLLLPRAHATSGDMLLFWDPANGSVPSGWCLLSGYNGFFPKASSVSDTATNWGSTFSAPSRPNSMTTNTIDTGPTSSGLGGAGGNNNSFANYSAGNIPNDPIVSYTSDSNGDSSFPDVPLFQNLQLMEYGSGSGGSCTGNGIPNIIPNKAIALFDTSSLPSGWSDLTALHGRMIRVDSAACSTHCGGDNESNNVTVSGLSGDGSGATNQSTFLGISAASLASHTHAPPATLTCSSGCSTSGAVACTFQSSNGSPTTSPTTTGGTAAHNTFTCTADATVADPPYVQPVLAQNNNASGSPTIALNFISMFDNDPGVGWVVLSNSGGIYNNQFIRAAGSPNLTSIGQVNRPAQTFTGTTGNGIGTANTLTFAGTTIAAGAHNHSVSITTNGGTVSNYPPYFDVVVAQKVNFTLTQYQWYVEPSPGSSSDTSVSDPWPVGSLNTAVNSGVVALPAAFSPPLAGQQLRLRVQIQVTGQNLAASNLAFKLQYNQGTTTDCLSGSWTDVAASSATTDTWRYGTDIVTDPTTIPNGQTVFTGPASDKEQLYQKSASTSSTNPVAVTAGQYMEYDWLLQDYSAPGATQYNFRVVEDHDPEQYTILSVYNACPLIVTQPTTDQVLRHGEFFRPDFTSGDPDQGFEWAN